MESLSLVLGSLVAVVAAILAVMLGIAGYKNQWRTGVTTLTVVSLILVALMGVALGLMPSVKKTAPYSSQLPPKEEYFYRVRWEGETKDGKTLLLAEDSSGVLYWAEISEPLGVKEVPVMAKEKFKPLLPLPEEKPAKSGN